MPARKRQPRIDQVLDQVVDRGIDTIFDRLGDILGGVAQGHRAATAALPPEARQAVYKCAGCHQMFPFEACAMVSAKGDGFATCEKCFRFMWQSANEKLLALKQGVRGFAQQGPGATQARRPAGAEPPGPKPWEVLGVDVDASVEEIKKAYRRAAAAAHPDRVPPGAPDSEREAARARFEEVDRAYKVMMKVRSAAT